MQQNRLVNFKQEFGGVNNIFVEWTKFFPRIIYKAHSIEQPTNYYIIKLLLYY